MISAAVVGASGYIGGELLRLLLGHPNIELVAATSRRLAGRWVDGTHPNLRGHTRLRFRDPEDVPPCDVLFVAVPHGVGMGVVPDLVDRAECLIDLGADFRLRDPSEYRRHYGAEHTAPALLESFVTGLPEQHRERLASAKRVAVPGCMATAAILALRPLIDVAAGEIWVDGRIGSSGSGASAAGLNIHAERSAALRVFAPVGHRHEAEIAQATGLAVTMSATGMPSVRGAQVLCRVPLARRLREPDIRARYREHYADEPFVRVVAERRGLHRLPEPKILAGSNHCDVGFALDAAARHVVAVAALDNLVKGAAGNALQCLNVRMGWPETTGLEFVGLHPV